MVFVFQKLGAVVSLPGKFGEIHAMAGEVDGELFGQEGGVGFGEFVRIAGEAGAGDWLAGSILEAREFKPGHLQPIMGDVLEIFGVGGKLTEERPEAFDRAELFFGVGFFLARQRQAVLADDAGDGVMAAMEVELMFEAFGPEAGLAAEFDDLAFEAGRCLVGTVIGTAGKFSERGGLARLMAAEPFADRVAGTAELTRGGLDAVLDGEGDELLVEEMAVGTHLIQFKVGAVHPDRITGARGCACSSEGAGAAHLFAENSAL